MKNEDKKWCVYMHTSPSNKVYIGITCDVKHRWRNHGEGYKGGTRIYYAIRKYGWENFKHEILFTSLTREEACSKEIELIAQYKSTDAEYGYNLCAGGKLGPTHEETRRRLSAALMGHRVGPEVSRRVADQISIPIICLDTMKEYKSAVEAANELNVNPTNIRKVCIGKGKTCRGLRFANKSDYENGTIPEFHEKPGTKKKVICVSTGIIYDSVCDASEKTGINRRAISYACDGTHASANKQIWAFLDEYEEMSNYSIGDLPETVNNPIICIETGEIYSCAKDAAIEFGVNLSSIRRATLKHSYTCQGLHFMKVSDLMKGDTIESDWANSRVKNVICVTTGKKYKSLSAASRDTGIDRKTIAQACKGIVKHAGGLHWRFLNLDDQT
jgi:group I intron endonuclease